MFEHTFSYRLWSSLLSFKYKADPLKKRTVAVNLINMTRLTAELVQTFLSASNFLGICHKTYGFAALSLSLSYSDVTLPLSFLLFQ